MSAEDGSVLLQRITIDRLLLPTGEEVYKCEFTDFSDADREMPWMDGLALIEAAKFDLYERIGGQLPRAD